MEYEGGGGDQREARREEGGGRRACLGGVGRGAGGVLRTCPVVGSKNPPRGF